MNDIVIFAMGCIVSLFVASAVGLLLWGAANEPKGSLAATQTPADREAQTRIPSSEPAPESPSGLGSRSPA